MINQQSFLDKTNYNSNVYLRCALIGLLSYFKDRIGWVNEFENGPVPVLVPFHAPILGQNRWALDAFKDDIADTRVEMNVDQVPRGVIKLKSWSFKGDEFCNPNVWFNSQVEVDDEIRELVAQVKAVPIKITFNIELIVDTQIDQLKIWQSCTELLFIYRYISFDFKRIPVNGTFQFPVDQEMVFPSEKTNIGEVDRYKLNFDVDLHTHFPIVDYKTAVPANRGVQWILRRWYDDNFDETPPDTLPSNTD